MVAEPRWWVCWWALSVFHLLCLDCQNKPTICVCICVHPLCVCACMCICVHDWCRNTSVIIFIYLVCSTNLSIKQQLAMKYFTLVGSFSPSPFTNTYYSIPHTLQYYSTQSHHPTLSVTCTRSHLQSHTWCTQSQALFSATLRLQATSKRQLK